MEHGIKVAIWLELQYNSNSVNHPIVAMVMK